MSFEAVPCMVRAPTQDGTKGEAVLGLIIRPSSTQDGHAIAPPPPPPGVIPIKGAKSIVIQPGSKRSLILSNEQIQKMVLKQGIRMGPSLWNPSLPSTSSAFHSPPISSPQSLEVFSPSTSRLSLEGASASTPDSGFQSVPPTPPPQGLLSNKSEEKADEEIKFDDMPRLLPVDQIDQNESCSSERNGLVDESSIYTGSECESSLPSSLTNTSWNPEEIASQLLSMAAFDPQKIEEVTALMLQRSKEDVNKKEEKGNMKRKNIESVKIRAEKKKRKVDQEPKPSTSKEQTEETTKEREASEEEPRDKVSNLMEYRLAMKRRMNEKVDEAKNGVMDDLNRLSIDRREEKVEEYEMNPMFRPIKWEKINEKKRLRFSEMLANFIREKRKTEKSKSGGEKRKKKEDVKRVEEVKKLKRRREEIKEEYETIDKNILHPSSSPLPSLLSSSLCHCHRSSCLSSDCLNRSSHLFCSPSTCNLSSCSNRLSSFSSLILSKGILKTKDPKNANEFLGEITGEIISNCEMLSRISTSSSSSSSSSSLRSFAFSPSHFLDSSSKGNITRYLRHSCQPNSVIQIWWAEGIPHLCLFSLFPLSSSSSITVDLSFITPISFTCSCSSRHCLQTIPPSTSILRFQSRDSESSLFLRRNLRQKKRLSREIPSKSLYSFYRLIDQRLRRIDGKMDRKLGPLLYKLRLACESDEKEEFVFILSQMEDVSENPAEVHSISCVRNRLMKGVEKKEEDDRTKKKRRSDSNPNRFTDVSYLDTGVPVGSYNPDEWIGEDKSTSESVRCVCGVLEDDGEMVECDQCHFWLHSDCLSLLPSDSYSCPLCLSSTPTPHGDVILKTQPQIRLDGCTYYKALENGQKMQMRLNETVYVRRLKSDNYKKILRGLESKKGKSVDNQSKDEPLLSPSDQDDTVPPRSLLRVFRVERLFQSPGGHRFLFGFYYARPHETFCDENRSFHPNEVFATPFYDTLPLDAVVGKCVVMDTSLYCKGRPIYPSYKEQDVLVCEYHLDRNQRHFDKCKNTYFLNTEPYAFQKFERARSLQRCFTPFTYPSSSSTPIAIAIWSEEEATGFQRQQSTKRINAIAKRITSAQL